jgi:hypothetical protein
MNIVAANMHCVSLLLRKMNKPLADGTPKLSTSAPAIDDDLY